MSTIILMAPMQIKKQLNIGNIYDLVLCDFYNKCLGMRGVETFFPILFNINGSPIEKIAPPRTESRDEFYDCATSVLSQNLDEIKLFSISYDAVLRDDDNKKTVSDLLPEAGRYIVNRCPNCGSIYGSDLSIKSCRRCSSLLRPVPKMTYAMHANANEIRRKVDGIKFVPESTKLRLNDFMSNLPEEYDIILEKDRRYTTVIDGIQIDPRFTAISLLDAARKMHHDYPRIIYIHGDVVKKFMYYALAYLPDNDMPSVDVMHGSIMDDNHKKARLYPSDGAFNMSDMGLNNRDLRAFFLSSSARNDIVLNKENILSRKKILVKTFVLGGRVCEERNYIAGTSGVRDQIRHPLEEFYTQVDHWNLPRAFEIANGIIHNCWKIVKDSKLTEEEVNVVKKLRSVYYGD